MNATAEWTAEERRLAACIQELTGSRARSFDRQVRHRPAWFVQLEPEVGAEARSLYVRGDRGSDVQPFPELRREADIFAVLDGHDIPVPQVHGMCTDPEAIVMEAVAGTRDTADAADDETRRAIAHEYIDILAALHRLPVEDFAEIGLGVPSGSTGVSLAGLDAYLPLYERHKARPEPLLELAIRWLRDNVPPHRDSPAFVTFDAGQFLFDGGRITAILDLEFAMIGDPYADLASMALREPTEPMGAPIEELLRRYAELVDEPVDIDLLRYHQVVFATVSCMQFVGALANPASGDPHEVYVGWDIYLRRCLVLVLAEVFGIDARALGTGELPEADSAADPLTTMAHDTIAQIPKADPGVRSRRAAALSLARYQGEVAKWRTALDAAALADASRLGLTCADRPELDAALEAKARTASGAEQRALFEVLANDSERRRLAHRAVPLGRAGDHAVLTPAGSA